MAKVTFRVWRGDARGGALHDYDAEVSEGMVVLDALHQIQAEQANDLAIRWNCKAGRCGSCSVRGGPDGSPPGEVAGASDSASMPNLRNCTATAEGRWTSRSSRIYQGSSRFGRIRFSSS